MPKNMVRVQGTIAMEKTGSKILHVLLGALLVFMAHLPSAFAASVSAQADRNVMRPGDTFTITVSVDADAGGQIEQPIWPALSHFQLMNAWSGSEVRSVYDNGQFMTVRRQTFSRQYQAVGEGDFEIGSIQVMVDGQANYTKPFRVRVVQGATQAPSQAPSQTDPQGQDPQDQADDMFSDMDDMFQQLLQDRIKRFRRGGGGGGNVGRGQALPDLNADDVVAVQLVADKKTVYQGEQITASYYLLTRGQISDIDTLKYPNLTGFWKEDIELATRLNFTPEVINGIQYNRALLASYALFPIQPGKATIDDYKAKCTVVSFNPFGMSGSRAIVATSKPFEVTVLPLPKEGQPADFSGAVGEYTIHTTLDNKTPKTNQPVSLKIRFEGRGNGKLIELPKLALPKGIDVYDSKSESKYFPNGKSYKEFEYLLIPRQAGEVEIPAMTVSFFNPEQKKYYTLTSDAIHMNVQPGDGTEQIPSSPLAEGQSGSEFKAPRGPQFPPQLLQYESGHRSAFFNAYVWSGLYLAVFAFLGWFARVELGLGRKRDSLKKTVARRIQRSKQLLAQKDWRRAASEATNLVYHVLGELSEVGGGSEELARMLDKAPPSFRREYQADLEKLMRELEIIAFAPEDVVGKYKEKAEVSLRLDQIEKILYKAAELDFQSQGEDKS